MLHNIHALKSFIKNVPAVFRLYNTSNAFSLLKFNKRPFLNSIWWLIMKFINLRIFSKSTLHLLQENSTLSGQFSPSFQSPCWILYLNFGRMVKVNIQLKSLKIKWIQFQSFSHNFLPFSPSMWTWHPWHYGFKLVINKIVAINLWKLFYTQIGQTLVLF